MKTFKITETYHNFEEILEFPNVSFAWKYVLDELNTIALDKFETEGLEEDWDAYYATEEEALKAHIDDFVSTRLEDYEVEIYEPAYLSLRELEDIAHDFIEKYELDFGHANVEDFGNGTPTLSVIVEAPNNWTNEVLIDIENIESEEAFLQALALGVIDMISFLDVEEQFREEWSPRSAMGPIAVMEDINADYRYYISIGRKLRKTLTLP